MTWSASLAKFARAVAPELPAWNRYVLCGSSESDSRVLVGENPSHRSGEPILAPTECYGDCKHDDGGNKDHIRHTTPQANALLARSFLIPNSGPKARSSGPSAFLDFFDEAQ